MKRGAAQCAHTLDSAAGGGPGVGEKKREWKVEKRGRICTLKPFTFRIFDSERKVIEIINVYHREREKMCLLSFFLVF